MQGPRYGHVKRNLLQIEPRPSISETLHTHAHGCFADRLLATLTPYRLLDLAEPQCYEDECPIDAPAAVFQFSFTHKYNQYL